MGALLRPIFILAILFLVSHVSARQLLADSATQPQSEEESKYYGGGHYGGGHYGGHYGGGHYGGHHGHGGHGGHYPPKQEETEKTPTTQEKADVVDPQHYGGGYGGYGHGGYGHGGYGGSGGYGHGGYGHGGYGHGGYGHGGYGHGGYGGHYPPKDQEKATTTTEEKGN